MEGEHVSISSAHPLPFDEGAENFLSVALQTVTACRAFRYKEFFTSRVGALTFQLMGPFDDFLSPSPPV